MTLDYTLKKKKREEKDIIQWCRLSFTNFMQVSCNKTKQNKKKRKKKTGKVCVIEIGSHNHHRSTAYFSVVGYLGVVVFCIRYHANPSVFFFFFFFFFGEGGGGGGGGGVQTCLCLCKHYVNYSLSKNLKIVIV